MIRCQLESPNLNELAAAEAKYKPDAQASVSIIPKKYTRLRFGLVLRNGLKQVLMSSGATPSGKLSHVEREMGRQQMRHQIAARHQYRAFQ